MPYEPYLGGELPNLVNVTKRMDPDGTVAKIAELLMQSNPMLQDVPLIEGNLPTGHRTTVRADMPVPTWRLLNYGVRPTKSETAQVDDTIGMLEAYSEIDKDLAMLNGNTAEFRMSEDTPHLEGMANTMAETLFYGDVAVNPERFHGFAPRYGQLDLTGTKPDAVVESPKLPHVIDLQGTTDLTSVWFIIWGEDACHGIYPKGSKAGLISEDLGEVTLQDNDGGRFQGFRSHYQWKMGLCVRDWRCIVRIANVSLTDLDDPDAQKALYQAMIKALHTVPAGKSSRGKFYCGAAISAMLDMAAVEKANMALALGQAFGQEVLTFRGRPIRECTSILETEVALT